MLTHLAAGIASTVESGVILKQKAGNRRFGTAVPYCVLSVRCKGLGEYGTGAETIRYN